MQQHEELRIEEGRITGVSVGDVYGVTKLGAAGFTSQTAVARVELERVEALHAVGRRIEWLGGHTTLPETAVAWPLKRALARHAVRIDAPASERAALEAEVDRSARLRVAGAGELAIGELRVRGGELRVLAGDGARLDRASGTWTIAAAVSQLAQLAAAQTLRELEGEHGLADEEIEIAWGTLHRGGVRIAQPAHGAALGLGDRIYVHLLNRTRAVRFAHIFNVGLRGTITRLSSVAELGIRLGPAQDALVTPTPDPSHGFELSWPADVPRDEPGVDTLLVIVTAQPADLRALETEDVTGARGRAWAAGSPLQRLVSQLHEGGTRSAAEADPFFVARRSYVLHPLAAALAGPGFAVDEDPLAVHAALRPEVWLGGAARPARPVEVRLRELSADRAVRIDALVCTRSAEPAGVYQARTLRVDAGAAARGGALLWRGPVTDLLDLYLWVAPGHGGPELAELLAPALARPDLAEARGALVVDDGRAPWSLAGGASLALARAAGELLRDAAPETEGLLHTSFAAHEGYGIGRQPASGRYRGHGVALGLSIRDAGDQLAASSARTRSASQV